MGSTARALLLAGLYARLSTLEDALEKRGWLVDACQEPREAIELLSQRDYWSIFCDEHLKGASPGGFLAYADRLAPRVPFYLFSADPEKVRFVGDHRPYGYLTYPPNIPTLPGPVGATEYDRGDPELPLEGSTDQLALPDLLEMFGLTQRDAVVALQGEVRGSLHIENGILTHAVSRDRDTQVGIRALADLLRAEPLDYKVLTYQKPERSTVRMRVASALAEAAKLVDELRRGSELLTAAQEKMPFLIDAATGYPLAQEPTGIVGDDARKLFDTVKRLLEEQREPLGNVTHQAIESDRGAIALARFGDGNVVAVRVPRGKSLVALSTLIKLVRALD